MSTGTCSVHTWNDGADLDEGEAPLGQSYNSKLEPLQPSNHRSADEGGRFTGHIRRNEGIASLIALDDDDPLDMNSW